MSETHSETGEMVNQPGTPIVDQEQPQEQEQEMGITVQDLFSAMQIIDVATKRGAFSAAEAGGVGMTYTKITDFLKVAAPHLFEQKGGNNE